MRRAIVLIFAVTTMMGMASSAAVSCKPLKTHDRAARASSTPGAEDPLPDANIIPPLKQHFEYVLPGSCVAVLVKGQNFKCHGPDKEHLSCDGLIITVHGRIGDCFEINVVKDK